MRMSTNPRALRILALALLLPPGLHAREDQAPLPPVAPVAVPTPEPPRTLPFDARTTRLFFAPTARSLPRGSGSAALTEVLFPSVEAGLTDRLSISAIGVLPLEDVSDGGIVLGPKFQLLGGPRVQAAVGVFQAIGAGGGTGGVGYGVVTLGSGKTAATIGYGYGYGDAADSEGSPGVVFLGVETALSRSFRLMVEGYVGGEAFGLPDQTLMVGARLGRGRFSMDLGVVVPVYETGAGSPFPIFAIAWAF